MFASNKWIWSIWCDRLNNNKLDVMITYFSLSSTSSWLVSENGKNKQNINSAVSHIFSACLIILHVI